MKTVRCIRNNVDVMVPVRGGFRVKFNGDRVTLPDEVVNVLLGFSIPGFYEILLDNTDAVLKSGAPILIIRDMGLGDVLLTTPLIREMAKRGGVIDVATQERYRGIFDGNPHVRRTISLENDPLNSSEYAAVIDLRQFAERLDNNGYYMHRAQAFGEAVDLPISSHSIDYSVFSDEREWATEEIKTACIDGPLVGYVWRASHDTRSWSAEKHAGVLAALIRAGLTVLVLDEHCLQMPFAHARLWDMTGRYTIRQTAAMLEQCSAVITPDTGIFHLASALGRPVVSYFSTFPIEHRATHAHLQMVGNARSCALWPCRKYTCLNRDENRMPHCLDAAEDDILSAVGRAVQTSVELKPPAVHTDSRGVSVDWATAIGAWGDVMVSLSRARSRLLQSGQEKCGVVYYGHDASVADFIEAQSFVREVKHVRPVPSQYRNIVRMACEVQTDREAWLPAVLGATGIDINAVTLTHVTPSLYAFPVYREFPNPQLPREWEEWAKEVSADWGDDWYLLNPFSTQSVRPNEHWPHWNEATDWLADREVKCVLVGAERRLTGDNDNLINLTGQVPTMGHVLALANRAGGIISTSNSLSLWSVMTGKPAVIALNTVADNQRNVFRVYLDHEPNILVGQRDRFEVFEAAWEMLRERTGGAR